MNNFTLLMILTGVSSDTLMTGCLLGAVSSNSQELKKLGIVTMLLLLQTSIFYFGWKSGLLLMACVKGGTGLMGAMVLLALGIKMTAEWTFKSTIGESMNIYNMGLLMTGTAVYVFAAGNAFGLLKTNNHTTLLVLPAFLLLFLGIGRLLTNKRSYLNWLYRICSLMVIIGAAILLVQNL